MLTHLNVLDRDGATLQLLAISVLERLDRIIDVLKLAGGQTNSGIINILRLL